MLIADNLGGFEGSGIDPKGHGLIVSQVYKIALHNHQLQIADYLHHQDKNKF